MFQNSYINEQGSWDDKTLRYSKEAVPFGDEIVLFHSKRAFLKSFFLI